MKRLAVFFSVLLMLSLSLAVSAEGPDQSYIINLEGKRQPIPLAYSVESTYSYFDLPIDKLNAPTDIFIDKADQLYILDAGNGRILKLSSDGTVLREYIPDGENQLSNPSGLFVTDNGDIYIADTGNGRVLVLDSEGNVIHTLVQPDSELYDKDYPFNPLKVGVDTLGQIYVINDMDYHGFTILDLDNNFKGYLAATRVQTDFWSSFINLFASESQKEQAGRQIPPQHTNFCITDDGSLYTTTANVTEEQMKRYSTVGNNFYPYKGAFGDSSTDYIMQKFGKTDTTALFVDVYVDADGIVTLLDNATGRLYQYDPDGIMLNVFGGIGNWAGRFMNPVALAGDSAGNLYVLDKNLNTVQVFKPTKFIQTVHEALRLYNSGKYVDAVDLWQQILADDNQYVVAHIGMGKAEYKQGNFLSAMEEYSSAGEKTGYSDAFSAYSKQLVQQYFLWIILALVAVVSGVLFLLSRLWKRAKALNGVGRNGWQIGVMTVFTPTDGLLAIKRDRTRFSYLAPTLILAFCVVSNVASLFVTHYPLTTVNVLDVNLFQQVFSFLLPVLLWIVSLYYVTCIFSGEVKLREVYAATAYAFLPYALLTLPIALFTNLLGIGSAGLISLLTTAVGIWVGILIIMGIKEMNSFSMGKTVLVILVSVLAALFIAVIAVLLYVLGAKLFDFLSELLQEYRLLILD